MHGWGLFTFSVFFLVGCSPPSTWITSERVKRPTSVYDFTLPYEEIQEMKEEVFARVLHRPHPKGERDLIANLPRPPKSKGRGKPPKRFVSDDGFPLITFRGGPISLGEALELIAGSSGYSVEWEEGVNKVLPVETAFTETPLDKAVAVLLEPFGYFALVDGEKGTVKVSLRPEVVTDRAPRPLVRQESSKLNPVREGNQP